MRRGRQWRQVARQAVEAVLSSVIGMRLEVYSPDLGFLGRILGKAHR